MLKNLESLSKESPSQEKQKAAKQLADLGIETVEENVEALIEQKKINQHPDGYDKIMNNLDNSDKIKELMQAKQINSIVHSEGSTVWDHVRATIDEINKMEVSEDRKKDLRLIMLYHDLGKTTAGKSEKNAKQTEKKIKKGQLFQTMIGHAKENLDEIKAGFQANGLTGKKLDQFMTVVENHMNTSLLDQDPKKTVKLFEKFGETEEEKKYVVELLTDVLQADANGTEHIDLVDNELKYSKNEKKLQLDFKSVWGKYEEGLKMIAKEEQKAKKKKEQQEFEKSIFGKKMSDYLIQDRGIKPGPDMGKSIGKIKGLMAKNKDLPPEEIKSMIDRTEL